MSNIFEEAAVGPDHRSPAGEKDKTACTVIDKLVGDIVKSVNPLQIILFGSAARGDAEEHSDIDLLVVMPEGVHRRRTAQKLYREITGLGIPFDIVVATPQDLEKHKDNRGLIYKSALKEGIEIYLSDRSSRELGEKLIYEIDHEQSQ